MSALHNPFCDKRRCRIQFCFGSCLEDSFFRFQLVKQFFCILYRFYVRLMPQDTQFLLAEVWALPQQGQMELMAEPQQGQ